MVTAQEAAGQLGVSKRRILALIKSGRLKAERLGNMYWIEPHSLEAVRVRKSGRPPTAKQPASSAFHRGRLAEVICRMAKTESTACTPGPWETRVFYAVAGVFENGKGDILSGNCAYCASPGAALVKIIPRIDVEDEITVADPTITRFHKHKWIERDAESWRTVYANDGTLIIGSYNYEMGGVCTNEADARLIAAAPDLLAALKGVVAIAGRKTVEFDKARAAIRKAEGGE